MLLEEVVEIFWFVSSFFVVLEEVMLLMLIEWEWRYLVLLEW
jgi:hypothetical protein